MKKTKRIFLYTISFLVLNQVCKTLTDDFSVETLVKPAPQGSKWELKQELEPSLDCLKQKFTYLGKGKQAYVFASEDGSHVLKVFKPYFPKYEISLGGKTYKLGLSKLPLFPTLFTWMNSELIEKQKEKDFESYLNAFHLLKEETQLEYVHLTRTNHLCLKAQLFDKIGVLHEIDLDSTCFLLQKKTDLFYPTLASLLKKGQTQEAERLIQGYVDLSLQCVRKGVINPTTVEKNIGCLNGLPIHIDVGRILQAKEGEKKPVFDDVYVSTHHLKKWLFANHPSLVSFLDNLILERKETYEATL